MLNFNFSKVYLPCPILTTFKILSCNRSWLNPLNSTNPNRYHLSITMSTKGEPKIGTIDQVWRDQHTVQPWSAHHTVQPSPLRCRLSGKRVSCLGKERGMEEGEYCRVTQVLELGACYCGWRLWEACTRGYHHWWIFKGPWEWQLEQ